VRACALLAGKQMLTSLFAAVARMVPPVLGSSGKSSKLDVSCKQCSRTHAGRQFRSHTECARCCDAVCRGAKQRGAVRCGAVRCAWLSSYLLAIAQLRHPAWRPAGIVRIVPSHAVEEGMSFDSVDVETCAAVAHELQVPATYWNAMLAVSSAVTAGSMAGVQADKRAGERRNRGEEGAGLLG